MKKLLHSLTPQPACTRLPRPGGYRWGLLALLLTGLLALPRYTQAQVYRALSVTGFTADVVANANLNATQNTTTATFDGGSPGYVLYERGYQGTSGSQGLPVGGSFTSAVTSGLPYQLASYSANNALRLAPGASGTLTLSPYVAVVKKVYILVASGGGASTIDVTMNFSNGGPQTTTGVAVPDWYGGANAALAGFGRVLRNNVGASGGSPQSPDNSSPGNPRLYELAVTVPPFFDVLKLYSVIIANNTGSGGIVNVMGISAELTPTTLNAGPNVFENVLQLVSVPAGSTVQAEGWGGGGVGGQGTGSGGGGGAYAITALSGGNSYVVQPGLGGTLAADATVSRVTTAAGATVLLADFGKVGFSVGCCLVPGGQGGSAAASQPTGTAASGANGGSAVGNTSGAGGAAGGPGGGSGGTAGFAGIAGGNGNAPGGGGGGGGAGGYAGGTGGTGRLTLVTVAAPTLTSLSPTSGPAGTTVTLTGTDFTSTSTVSFGGTAATVTYVSSTSLTAPVPAGAGPGVVSVTVSTAYGTTSGINFTVTAAPTVTTAAATSITTSAGSSSATLGGNVSNDGGVSVTDRGVVYSSSNVTPTTADTKVQIGSGTGSFLQSVTGLSPNTLYYVRAYAINSVGTGYGAVQQFTTPALPTLTSLNPTSGPVGTSVAITGTGFTAGSTVDFNGTAATSVTFNSATSLTALVPTGATSGNVTVTSATGTSNGINFTVAAPAPTLTSLNPTSGPVGTSVTLTGTNFTSGSTVSFNGTAATVTFNSATSLTAIVPTGATTGNVTVTTAGGTTSGLSFTVTASPPTLTALSPTSGPVGTSVTITGTGFLLGGNNVYFNGTLITSGSTNSTTSITAVVPTGATTGNVTVQNANGTSNGVNFTVPTPTITSLNPTSGPIGTSVSITGTNFALGGNNVRFNGVLISAGSTNSATSITAIVPNGATTGNVTVQNANGTSNGIAFTVTTANLTISTGSAGSPVSIAAGTYATITITGTGFGQLAGAVQVSGAFQVNGSLNTNCQALTGAGSFTLSPNATLYVCDAAGLSSTGATGAVQVSGGRSFASDASYIYNGTAAQNTGPGLPAQVRALTTTTNSPLTLSQPLGIAQTLAIGGSGNLALNGQALTLLSDATGTALAVNAGTGLVTGGTATVQRYLDPSLNAGLGYRHLAAPVSGATVGSLATTGFAPVVNGGYNSAATPGTVTPFPTVFGYDQSRVGTVTSNFAPFDQGWASPTALTDALTVGAGYTVNLAGGLTPAFTGTLTSGDQTLTLSRGGNAQSGWALVGNPYPAPLDFALVAPADRTGLDAAIYVFESSSQYAGSYRASVNGVGGNANSGSALVGSSQGFFVRVSNGQSSGTLTFRNAQRLTSYATQVPVRRGTADARPLVQLRLQGGSAPADNLFVYVQAGATAGLDREFDAVKRPNSTGLNLSAPVATGEALAIQGLPLLTAATVVPLTVDLPAAGAYALAAPALNNLPAGTRVELVDNLTGTRQDLRTLPTAGYAFTASATHLAGRFSLNLTPAGALATSPAALAAQVLAYPNPAYDRLTLVRPAGPATSAELVNALGQVVRRFALPTPETSLDVRELATGVYLLRLTLDGQPVRKRLLIE